MEGSTITAKILQDTPFKYPCNIYKENSIPILKDYNVSDNCKEIGKHILNMTKNPLSQHVDVLIPNLDRDNYAKLQMEHFKSFFGKKYCPEAEEQQTTKSNEQQQQNINQNTTTTTTTMRYPNAIISKSKAYHPINEFIEKEKNYVEILESLVTNVAKPIKESITNPNKQPIMDHYSYNRIFLNIDDILEVNKSFLASLFLYKNGKTDETFGEILQKHFETFDCYKIYLLGKSNALNCHKLNLKQNKLYSKFIVNGNLVKSLGMSEALIAPVHRLAAYHGLVKAVIESTPSNDSDLVNLRNVASKVANISDMRYGSDSSLLNLYHLIREAPASLIQNRKLLAYFDASELSLLSGKTNRPVTILVFTDKLMIVKRKNSSLSSKEALKNIEDNTEDNVKSGSSTSLLKKAKAYNSLPFEFKGWVDIKYVELFQGLKERPDSFFLRTQLPELDPNATEKECENYFRRSDRLYSMIPSTTRVGPYIEKKQELLSLCQKQFALSSLTEEDTTELYYEDKFKLPAYSHIYNEESYSKAEHKNNILIVYVEENYPIKEIDLNSLLTDEVWIVILLTRNESGGYKPTIRARTSLIPIREISREIEYESIIETNNAQKNGDAPLDFIDTLWNNLFFYERRLRATEAYSSIHDDLLRDRARSRSRSKSLTRVASNMSIGKLFARSRSTSPSRHSSSNERTDDDDDPTTTPISCVPDPIFKVATVNKHTENEFRQYSPPLPAPPFLSHKHHSSPVTTNNYAPTYRTASASVANNAAERGYRPSKINTTTTQPHAKYNHDPKAYLSSEIFVRDDHTFIDTFNEQKQEENFFNNGGGGGAHLSGSTNYQYNSHRRPSYPHHRHGGSISSNNLDSLLFHQSTSPEFMSRPSSSNTSSVSSETDRTMTRGLTLGDSLSSNTSSIRSYFDENNFFNSLTGPTTARNPHHLPYHPNHNAYDERVMSTIDNSKRSHTGGSTSSSNRAPLPLNFYKNPHQQNLPDNTMSNHVSQFKNEVLGMYDNYFQSEQLQKQHLRSQNELGRYHNTAEDFKVFLASKIDKLMEDLQHGAQHPYQMR